MRSQTGVWERDIIILAGVYNDWTFTHFGNLFVMKYLFRLLTASFCLILTFLLVPSDCDAENWPQFRGPTGQGHSTEKGLPVSWSTTENVTWKVGIPGAGWSSPVYDKGKLYLTTAISPPKVSPRTKTRLHTLCLNAKNGEILWNKEVFDQSSNVRIHKKNSHASPTPIVDGDRLYVHFGTYGTACLSTEGKILWKNRTLKYRPQHGNGGSPVLVDDLLVVSCDGGDVQFVVALDQQTGKVRWKTKRPAIKTGKKFSFSTPLVIEVEGQKQIVSPGTNHVIAYDPKSGDEIWKFFYQGYSVTPRPVFGKGTVFVATSFDKAKLLAIRPTGTGDITDSHLVWKTDRAAPHTPSPLLTGDELYIVSDRGIATCFEAATGKVHWQERLGGNYSASPIYADGKIYFQSEEGVGTVIKSGTTFEVLSKNDMQSRTLASYAIAEGAIFLRTATELYRIEK